MKREINTKFYTFDQNNSGGYFVENDEYGICETVIIEAITPEHAWGKLNEIGKNVVGFNDYCGCCGQRWSNYLDESDGTDNPEMYGEPIESVEKSFFTNKAFVHYIDGTMKEFIHL